MTTLPRRVDEVNVISWSMQSRTSSTSSDRQSVSSPALSDVPPVIDIDSDHHTVYTTGISDQDRFSIDGHATATAQDLESNHVDSIKSSIESLRIGAMGSSGSSEGSISDPIRRANLESDQEEDNSDEDEGLIITSSDYDILQNPQPVSLRNLLEDVDLSDSEEEPESTSSSPRFQTPTSTPYQPSERGRSLSSSPSESPSVEEMRVQGDKNILPPPLHMALALWFEKSGDSREDYTRLREILQLSRLSATTYKELVHPSADGIEDVNVIEALPHKLDTLKRQLRRHIPLLQLMRKALRVIIEKQPSKVARDKGERGERIERLSWMYWYEPIDLIGSILSATFLQEKMYFGMAEYAENDDSTELWHSSSWGSSIRTTSGDVAYTGRGELIIPGDILRIKDSPQGYHCGRVTFIGRDRRKDALVPNEIVLTLQLIADTSHPFLQEFDLLLQDPQELFLIEDMIVEVRPLKLDRRLLIHMDRNYIGEEDEVEEVYEHTRHYIRRVLSWHERKVRPLRQLHLMRGELEVDYFGRERLVEAFIKPHISFPYFLFIDDFGIHRNMYRALKAFYIIPGCLSYSERRKLANVFTLTLGPHGATIADVVEAFSRSVRKLDRGTMMTINGDEKLVCAHCISFLGDMPQQTDNAGFSHHGANMGCRTCLCPKSERGNLKYDIIGNGRYHWETTLQRKYAQDLVGRDRKAFVQETGIKIDLPSVARLAPALDLILSRPYDAPHSEWRGIGRILHSFLITTVLSKNGKTWYLKAFQNFRFPAGWPHIQSPSRYIYSWSLSESGRANLLLPLILRKHATGAWFRVPFLVTAARILGRENTVVRQIVKAFGKIAFANTLAGSQRHTDSAQLNEVIVEGRRAYQSLIKCAISTAEGFNRTRNDREALGEEDEEEEEDQVMLEVLSAAGESDDSAFLPTQPTGRTNQRGRPSSGNKFKKLLSLPNVHAGLHLADMAREYGTIMNLNVLAGEMKHMIFKAMADHASPANLMGYLFAKDVLTQSVRLGLAGAWDHGHPELVEALRMVHTLCPSLMQSFLPMTERVFDYHEGNDVKTIHHVQDDADHRNSQLSGKVYALQGQLRIDSRANLMRLPAQHIFVQQLMNAYEQAIGTRPLHLGSRAPRWYRRVAYTNPRNRRYVYNIGDFMVMESGHVRGRLAQCFTHDHRGKRHGFLIIDLVETCWSNEDMRPLMDPVLDLPVFKLTSEQRIYSIWELSDQDIYLVEAPQEPDWQTEEGEQYLIHCTWGVDYL